MKIYIDGLFYRGSGIGRYYESLVKELSTRGHVIYTVIPERLRANFQDDFRGYDNIQVSFVNYEKFSISGFFKHSEIVRKLEKKVDIFFFPQINLPLYVPNKVVTTVHDLAPFTVFWDRNFIKKFAFKFFLERAIKYSEKIICISNTVRDSLLEIYPQCTEKLIVIYRFVDSKFNSNFQKKHLLDRPYLLYVGNRKKNKNLVGLIKAFKEISNEIPHNLVIAGARDRDSKFDEVDNMINSLGLSDRVITFVSPDDSTIINLYHNADLFVFPSFFEGFGLPPLEAISLGCPVVLSDIPIFRELFEDSTLFFNPYDIFDIAKTIKKTVLNERLRLSLLDKQKEILKKFDRVKIIDSFENLIKSVCDK